MRHLAWGACLALALVLPFSVPLAAQDVTSLSDRCQSAAPTSTTRCLEGAIASQALLGQTGLLAGLGSEIAGSPTTLGRRITSTPRVALSLRAGGLYTRLPDLTDRRDAPASEARFFVPTLHGSVAVGVFDGFRLMPTVAGLLSVDLLAQSSILFLPEGQGFDGRVGSLSLGARLGILRESFTLPGITLSASRRFLGVVRLGSVPLGDPTEVKVDPSVSSYRLTVGKDLFAVGFLLGTGWDMYSTYARIGVADDVTGSITVEALLKASRALFFAGASLNFLVLQLSAELGWVEGLSALSGYSGAEFDPTRGSLFGSLAGRLTI
jgi:hypothetical protein